jgi:ATP synthase protein I
LLTASASCTDDDAPVVSSSVTPVQALAPKDSNPSHSAATQADSSEAAPASGDNGLASGDNGMDAYRRLQRRLIMATLMATALAVPLCWVFFDRATAASLLVGAVAGLLYLSLLARSVSRLGAESRSVSKVQLLVPVVLVLSAARIPALQMLPALVGFLLYKPALIVQAVFDS